MKCDKCKYKAKLSSLLWCNMQGIRLIEAIDMCSMEPEPSELETLRSENALLSERVKELEGQLELHRQENVKKHERILSLLSTNTDLTQSNKVLKESKTVYVRRCKNEL